MNPPKVFAKDFYLGLAELPRFGRRSDLSDAPRSNEGSGEPLSRAPYTGGAANKDDEDRTARTMEAFTSQKIRNYW